MGVVKLDAYVLIVRGKDSLKLLDGLSTNKVEDTCSTVFTTASAKVIDLVDVIVKEGFIALVGYNPHKQNLLQHVSQKILNQDITIGDASDSNNVYLSTKEMPAQESVTSIETFRGWLIVAPKSIEIANDMSQIDFDDYRVENMIPMQGYEVTSENHPLACGLGHLVHESKGCYVGQEILARMRSRGKQGKELVRLPNPVEGATTVGKSHSLVIRRVSKN
jgi:tRNA-modifying protein YgfZ